MTVEQRLTTIDEQLAQMTIVVGELVKSSVQQGKNIEAVVSGIV
jgi:hypothetical protein